MVYIYLRELQIEAVLLLNIPMVEVQYDPLTKTHTIKWSKRDESTQESKTQLLKTIKSPLEDYHNLPRQNQCHARTFVKVGRRGFGNARTYFDFKSWSIVIMSSKVPRSEEENIENEKMKALETYLARSENVRLFSSDNDPLDRNRFRD